MEMLARLPRPTRMRLRKKPKKLGEWRTIVAKSLANSVAALKELETGHYLWKVRQRKFRIDYEKLYLHYLPASNAISKKLYVVAPTKLFRQVFISFYLPYIITILYDFGLIN